MPGRAKQRAANRRGSPDAVNKRRAARAFNELLLGAGAASKLDGRTEKRRKRLYDELKEGQARASGKGLKPIEILIRIEALLAMGEPLAAIKKACRPPRPVAPTPEVIVGVKRLHEAYRFPPDTYLFVGIDEATLKRAGVLGRPALRKAPAPAGGGAASRSRAA